VNFLIDVHGVLYVGKKPIPGAQEIIQLLREKSCKFRFVSNATRNCRRTLQERLCSMGFDIKEEELFTAPQAAIRYVKECGKNRCYLLSTGDVRKDFERAGVSLTAEKPDFVVVGDAGDNFSFEGMNHAFRLIMDGASLIAMEKDRYWMSESGLSLSAGAFVDALEYSSGKQATLIGKPSKEFFSAALKEINSRPSETILIGDDIFTDICGAQKAGMKAYLVKTGKYRKEEVENSGVFPDAILKSIADLKDYL
jgi:HAD superfamily hydrolase (TIGR01458 family)